MKLLILGHGRHGKDTVAEYLQSLIGFTFNSSSMYCAGWIYEMVGHLLGYESIVECYDDRHNHRGLWRELIRAYTFKDPSRLAREILDESDIYVGMRSNIEYQASKRMFNHIIYVDALARTGTIDKTFDIDLTGDNIFYIDNNGSEADLFNKVQKLAEGIKWLRYY